jgi:homoserine/homoserine lactone efflux protein
MDLQLYLAFVAATAVLILIPGPNVALILANSVAHGRRFGLLTVAGTSSAMVLQLGVACLGLTALLGALAGWLEWLRWAGVAYLVAVGVAAWRASALAADLSAVPPEPRSARAIFARGFLVSLVNPKTLLFYGAFFPQFLSAGPGAWSSSAQVTALAATFLLVAVTLDSTWAVLADKTRPVFAGRARLRTRLTGGLLIGAGIGLALARKS